MPTDYSDKSVLLWDRGQFTFVAEKLAESFGQVKYYVPVESGFPTSNIGLMGVGLDGVERVYEFWDHVNSADLIVFPDVYDGDAQEYLRSLGKPVWGSGYTAQLELDRWGTHQTLKSLGEPVSDAKLLVGTDELADYLSGEMANEVCYIKASFFRGDFETRKHANWKLSEPWLDELRITLGPRKSIIQFIVEKPLEGVEIGYDAYHVGGVMPPTVMYGYEAKDAAYLGKVVGSQDLPEAVKHPTEVMLEMCRGVAANLHNEIRIGPDGLFYLIDPTMRCGSPPSESIMEAFSNWDEIMYEGARGNLVEAEPTCRFAAELTLRSDWVQSHWLPVYFPAKVKQWLKLHDHCRVDGIDYVVKHAWSSTHYPEIGAVVGIGDSMEEAIRNCMLHLNEIEAEQLDSKEESFDELFKTISEGHKEGIAF